MKMAKIKLIFGFLLLYASAPRTHAADTITANQILRYNQTIISPQEIFELGFFSPGNSTNHYVGIWYKKISTGTVVWVANRNTPLTHTSVELTLTLQGVLILRDATTGTVVWASVNSSARNPIGQLLDTGNFLIYDNNQENPIWQSFEFMTDTFLHGMKVGWDLVTGTERRYTSKKSNDDPAAGEFSAGLDFRGYPQTIVTDGLEIKFRDGPWNGLRFNGAPNLRPNPIYNFTFVLN
ncbi:putative non-specific serine/threonine protein kinase [Helianthus anomalus]